MEDIILKRGDIIKLEYGREFIEWGWAETSLKDFNSSHDEKVVEIRRPVKYETIYSKPETREILNEKEKEYLSCVIRPFRNRITEICKRKSQFEPNREIIVIYTERIGNCLPSFKENTMYKGMELQKEYTLKELGL